MIFTKVDALVKDIDVDKYHIETVILSSDDLNKKIIRVKSDHGNEFGIRLDKGQKLQNGSAFFKKIVRSARKSGRSAVCYSPQVPFSWQVICLTA